MTTSNADTPKVLIAEDVRSARVVLAYLIEQMGFQVIQAENGLQAVEACQRSMPDLVLMDVLMPVMDGFAATQEIRRLTGDRWVPIVFLSALTQESEKVRALEVGGDDFLAKPVDPVMLNAKIKSFLRIRGMQSELEAYRANGERERAVAAHVLSHMQPASSAIQGIDSYQLAAGHLNGDTLISVQSPTGQRIVMMADSTGHGLIAAICLQPAVNVFFAMASKGYSIGRIAREMNHKLREMLPTGHFLAAIVVCIDPLQDIVQVWNGGMPPVWVMDAESNIQQTIISQYPPLGILPDAMFNEAVEIVPCTHPRWLVMCSDGLIEAEDGGGNQFGEQALLAAFAGRSPKEGFAQVIDRVSAHLGYKEGHDDISLALLAADFDSDNSPEAESRVLTPHPGSSLEWNVSLTLNPHELQTLEVVPILDNLLRQFQLHTDQYKEVLLILTELFANALDHGVLKLDSVLKSSPEHFLDYYRIRAERLTGLKGGYVKLKVGRLLRDAGLFLELYIQDSGGGFDYSRISRPERALETSTRLHGRGLALVMALAESMEFLGNGNEVRVLYRLRI